MKMGRAYVESLFEQQTGLYTWVEVSGNRYYLPEVGPASVVDSSLFREGDDAARAKFYSNLGTSDLPHVRSSPPRRTSCRWSPERSSVWG